MKDKVTAEFAHERILTENSEAAHVLFDKSCFGEKLKNGRVQLSLVEALYLFDRGSIDIVDGRGKPVDFDKFLKMARKVEKNIWIRYCVYRDLRDRGFIVKTALKFGADFRVYGRGVKPGEDHAKWIVYAVHEGDTMTWYDFSAKNRVAHSTKKRLLLGIVDEETDVTYYEVKWLKP
ncbi:tRNA-intron lyase [Candidatus Woesearchaeota archaeon]|nr:tRNA-intron lyase [Candidatus Woesearchaeota archaeon]